MNYLPAWLQTVFHDGSEKYVSLPNPKLGDTVRLRVRTSHSEAVRRIVLRTFPDGEQSFALMHRADVESPVQWWEVDLKIEQPITQYRFIVDSTDGLWHYSGAGITAEIPLDVTDFRILAGYQPVEWLASAVFYQIFPDRFANGNPDNDPQPAEFEYRGQHPKTYAWGAKPEPDLHSAMVFYGGDLTGIETHLDYLTDLGVSAIYLNPIFDARTNHKYDVADYDQVDPHFGGNEALVSLRQALTARDMRYILDIVPNHCGYWHPWFQLARIDQTAIEADFFTFSSHPDEYISWLGVWSLPKLNYLSAELRRRMYEGPGAVFRRWLLPPFLADGWRVDVANMLGRQGPIQISDQVNRGIRMAVKETRHEAYLFGENFFDATKQLQGEQWDGVMNYSGFTYPLIYWLVGMKQKAHGFDEELSTPPWPTEAMVGMWQSRLAVIPSVVARQQYNLLDSHDTPRIRTVLGENDRLHRLAVAVLMTFPGVPGLYYGDEIGMTDDTDLKSRGCMIWDESRWNRPLRDFHRALIQLRRRSAALQRGGFQVLLIEPDTVAYQRECLGDRVIVIAHRGEKPRPAGTIEVAHGGVADGTRFVDWASGAELIARDGTLPLPEIEQEAMILQAID